MADITLLPSAKVPLIYPDTSGMTTEWYRFFWNVYGFTGDATGAVPVSKGGTGLTSIGEHQLIIGNAAGVFEKTELIGSGITITYAPGTTTLAIGNSGVTPGTYGSASAVGQFTVDSKGTLVFAQNVPIAIDATQIISGTIASARISGSYTGITGVGTLTAGTWNATTIGTAYGGTGLTSFTSGGALYATSASVLTSGTLPTTAGGTGLVSFTSGGALYATSTSALTSGTLPVTAGGTGQTSFTNGQLLIGNTTGNTLTKATLTAGAGVTITNGAGSITISATGSGGTVTAVTGVAPIASSGGTTPAISISQSNTTTDGYLSSTDWNTFNNKQPAGTYVTSISIASSNGFTGTSSGGATPSLTLATSVTGILKGNGTAISAATSGTDYAPATSGTSILYGNGTGGFSNVTIGTGVSFAGGTLSATGTGGTVTSVSGTGSVNGITLTGTVTSSGSLTLGGTLSGIGNSQLTNSTISGVALGGSLFSLTAGTGVSFSAGTTYNGSAAITINATGSGGTVTSVAALTLGTTGTDLSSTVTNSTTTPVITLNVPTASAVNRGALSAADWTTFNSKAPGVTFTTGYVPFGQGTTTLNQSSTFTYDGTILTSPAHTLSSGNLTFTGSAQRITGDFSGTLANRVHVQSSTTNGFTSFSLIPNGTNTQVQYNLETDSALANGSTGQIALLATEFKISTGLRGTGAYVPMTFTTGGSERLRISIAGNVGIGTPTPGFPLDVVCDASAFGIRLRGRSADSINVLRFTSNDGATTYGQFDVRPNIFFVNAVANIPLAFNTNNTERMRLFASGGVSIGNTTDPNATNLSVTGTIGTGGTVPATQGSTIEAFAANPQVNARASSTANLAVVGAMASDFVSGSSFTTSRIIQYGSTAAGTTAGLANASLGIFNFQNVSNALIYTNGAALSFGTVSVLRMTIGASGGVSIGNTTDPGNTNLSVTGTIVGASTIKTGGYTVATLPTGVTGARAYVTNALTPSFGATVVGGGAVTISVFYNGTNWIVG